MGSFGTKTESTLITLKRSECNAPSPAKMKVIDKRLTYLSEPEDNQKLNMSLFKEITGAESMVEARDLNNLFS